MTRLPKTLAQCADLYYETRQKRLALQKDVDSLQAEETALKDHLISNLQKDTTGVAGKVCRVLAVTKTKPQVEDWDRFYKYVSRTKGWDLLQRRVSDTAVKARWEEGKTVPGVTTVSIVDLSVSKL